MTRDEFICILQPEERATVNLLQSKTFADSCLPSYKQKLQNQITGLALACEAVEFYDGHPSRSQVFAWLLDFKAFTSHEKACIRTLLYDAFYA